MSYTVDNVVRELQELCDGLPTITHWNIREKLNKAIKELSSPDHIFIEWCTEDVYEKGKEKDLQISEENARELLSDMERKHDASIGINWDVIDCYLDNSEYNATPIGYVEEE